MELERIPARRMGKRGGPVRAAVSSVLCDREAGTIEVRLSDVEDFDQPEATYDVTVRFSTDEFLSILTVALSKDGRQGTSKEDFARLLGVRVVEREEGPRAAQEGTDGQTR
jgi:hypothetical protein